MWQAPNQRVRSIQSAKKRQQDRLKRTIHLKRVRAEIKIITAPGTPAQVSEARVILNDLTPTGMGIFAADPILVGQEIAITLEEPRRIYLKARVIWCQEYDVDSHVLQEKPFSYRMGIRFVFQSKDEEVALRTFCSELSQNLLYGKAA